MRASQLLHRARTLPDGSALVIFDAKNPFVHASQFQRSEVYVPEPVVDFFQADVLAGERVRDTTQVTPSESTIQSYVATPTGGWASEIVK